MNMSLPAFAFLQSLTIGLPVACVIASIVLACYLFVKRARARKGAFDERRQQELVRATRIVQQLETTTSRLREDLDRYDSQLATFKRQLHQAQAEGHDKAWEQLCLKAEAILDPTLQLAQQLSGTQDEIRQQSNALETFTQGRVDPLTGVGNGRALEQHLRVLLCEAQRGGPAFSVAILSLGHDGTTNCSSMAGILPRLPKLASIIRACMRDSDFVARYGDDEFVVVMPQTGVSGARVFAHRVRRRVVEELSATVNCGLSEVQEEDDARELLGRADSALYSAKAAGVNRLFVHTGNHIREDSEAAMASAVEQTCKEPSVQILGTAFISMPADAAV